MDKIWLLLLLFELSNLERLVKSSYQYDLTFFFLNYYKYFTVPFIKKNK